MSFVDVFFYPLLIGAGAAAGFVNTMAGGGSLVTVPLMIFLGMPAANANASNRVAVLVQGLAAGRSFQKAGLIDLRGALTLSACAVPGAVFGALTAARMDEAWFRKMLAVVMVGVLIATLWPQRKTATSPGTTPSRPRQVAAHVGMVAAGFYGGLIQAGAGFILMPILQRLLRIDLVRVNMLKVLITAVYTIPALAVFVYHGQVDWWAGLALSAGSAVGAVAATRLQLKRGEGPVRVVFAIAVVAMAIKLVID